LESIIADAYHERGAYINRPFVCPLDFILNSVVYDQQRNGKASMQPYNSLDKAKRS